MNLCRPFLFFVYKNRVISLTWSAMYQDWISKKKQEEKEEAMYQDRVHYLKQPESTFTWYFDSISFLLATM